MPRVADVAYFNHRPGHSESWKAAAVCGPIGTDPWYATGRESSYARKVGKRICNEICPVREHCLAYAFAAGIDHGTWGGLDEGDRAKVGLVERETLIDLCRRTPYDPVELHRTQEVLMVIVLAKVKFAPDLSPGEVGPVDDDLARGAVRAGYADLVGNVENFDEWMYHGAELKLKQGRSKDTKRSDVKAEEKAPAKKSPAKKTPAKTKPDADEAKMVEDSATA